LGGGVATSADTGDINKALLLTDSSGIPKKTKRRIPTTRIIPPGMSYSINERPPNRTELANLDAKLEERVQTILNLETLQEEAAKSGNLYQPHRDEYILIRDAMLQEFAVELSQLENEPWLGRLIKCQSLYFACDEVAFQMVDILAVSSTQLGNILRKLRLTYRQCFEEMRHSWALLRQGFVGSEKDLLDSRAALQSLNMDLSFKETQTREIVDREVAAMARVYDIEKARDKEALLHSEFKNEQLAETLKTMGGIFKAMQSDSSGSKTLDLITKCEKLERENAQLAANVMTIDKTRSDLDAANAKIRSLEIALKIEKDSRAAMSLELSRRDDVINAMMEKEALKNAQLEKLQLIIDLNEKEKEKLEFKDPATSVLCVKCKKSLDDMANIRAAVLGSGGGPPGPDGTHRVSCEAYRILLPNLKGRRPHRSIGWLRACMRYILFAKLREDVNLLGIHGETTRFPQFIYAWFDRNLRGFRGAELAKELVYADEDRWGLYYAVKSLTRDNDPEALVFWSLLDESFGDDGVQFVLHCLSIVLSVSGSFLWEQFGDAMGKVGNINVKKTAGGTDPDAKIRRYIWLDIETAKEAAKLILVRALQPHVLEVLEAIDALCVIPEVEILMDTVSTSTEAPATTATGDEDEEVKPGEGENLVDTPTHINLFLWLRLMLQQLHSEQIHRGAAVKLMFETASIGALTPQIPGGSGKGSTGIQVEYPQFQSICKTLFPIMGTAEIATFFMLCYQEGQRKVTAEILLKVADIKGLFARHMRLAAVPLLERHAPLMPTLPVESASGEGDEASAVAVAVGDGLGSEPAAPPVSRETILPPTLRDPMVMDREAFLRVKLGSLIHRKMAAIVPELHRMCETLPPRWSSLVSDGQYIIKGVVR
jgi:hypothetical protein